MSEHKQQYDRDGFVVIREFLPPDELAELQANLDRYIRDVVPSLPSGDAFYQDRSRPETLKQLQHMGHDPFFVQYREHPRWQQLAEELIGEPSEAKDPEWFYFCQRPPHVATLWLALDTVDEENGCLRYVAGSHRRGIRPHLRTGVLGFSQGITDYGPEDKAGEVTVHLAPGDLVAHHGETIHRAEPNRSASRHRRAFAIVFQGASCRRDEDAFARYEAALHSQHAEIGLVTS